MNIPDLIAHLAGILLSTFILYWAGARLNCLFFSAFESAQSDLILNALPAPLRLIGIQHWLYNRFFSGLKACLLLLYYLSIVFFAVQFFFSNIILYWLCGIYAAAGIGLMAFWFLNRIPCCDQKRHIPYNAFAPLHEKQRRELNAMRNRLQLSVLLQRWDLFRQPSEYTPNTDSRGRISNKYQKY